MIDKIKTLIFDRTRSENEYKIIIQVLERMNLRNSLYVPMKDIEVFGDDAKEFFRNERNPVVSRELVGLFRRGIQLEKKSMV